MHTDSGPCAARDMAISDILAKWGSAMRGWLDDIAGERKGAQQGNCCAALCETHPHTYGVSMHGVRPFTFLLVAARDTQCYLLEEEGVQTPSPVLPALLGCSVYPVHGLRGRRGTAALRHSRQCPNTTTTKLITWVSNTNIFCDTKGLMAVCRIIDRHMHSTVQHTEIYILVSFDCTYTSRQFPHIQWIHM